jgi:hypothetical protein
MGTRTLRAALKQLAIFEVRISRSVSLHLFLDPHLEVLENCIVRLGPVHFLVKLTFDAGMLGFEGAEMRTIHGWSSLD